MTDLSSTIAELGLPEHFASWAEAFDMRREQTLTDPITVYRPEPPSEWVWEYGDDWDADGRARKRTPAEMAAAQRDYEHRLAEWTMQYGDSTSTEVRVTLGPELIRIRIAGHGKEAELYRLGDGPWRAVEWLGFDRDPLVGAGDDECA